MENEGQTVWDAWLFPRDLLQWSKQLANFIAELLDDAAFPADDRLRVTAALFDLALEHHTSIIDLIDLNRFGSALAMARPSFEACVRGYWVYRAAPATFINDVASANDPVFPHLKDMLAQLQTAAGTPIEFFRSIIGIVNVLHELTHGGQRQIARRLVDNTVGGGKSDERIMVLLLLANTVAFHAASGACALLKDNARLNALQSKVGVHSPYLYADA